MRSNMDTLFGAVAARGHVCVGLDTAPDYVPPAVMKDYATPAEAVLAFNKAVVDATADATACYKVQIAYYEALGLAGLKAYAETLRYARAKGVPVIADVKRGDIADTATRYAEGHFSGDFEADFVTLNPYMGMDSIEPWLKRIEAAGKGAFALVRTSNPGMRDFEALELKDGGRVYHKVGDALAALAGRVKGDKGYGAVGAVVGCTEREEARELRERWPNLFFLIPGYGAQGGAAEDAAILLRNGNGGVVNASRSILKAWAQAPDAANATLKTVADASRQATIAMRDAIRAAAKTGGGCGCGGRA